MIIPSRRFVGAISTSALLRGYTIDFLRRIPSHRLTFDASAVNLYRLSTLFVVLFLSASFGPTVCAQRNESRPVARLISSSSSETDNGPRIASVTPGNVMDRAASLAQANAIERHAFEATNAIRIRHGLQPLVWDPALFRLARANSQKMAKQGYFSHITPDGQRLRDRIKSVGIQHFSVLAENIAYNLGYDDPGGFAVERWMVSEGHRANILSTEFRTMAIGAFVTPDGGVYLTQVFIAR